MAGEHESYPIQLYRFDGLFKMTSPRIRGLRAASQSFEGAARAVPVQMRNLMGGEWRLIAVFGDVETFRVERIDHAG